MAQRKPTKAELEYGRLRSTAAGLPSTTTRRQLQGTVKKAAVIAATVAGPGKAVKATQIATKAAKAAKVAKSAKTTAQKSKSNQVAKNSVKVTPANKSNPSNAKLNQFTNSTLKRMKSGENAKRAAKEIEAGNAFYRKVVANPEVIRLSGVKPYKITGGAGSTARRAGEKATKRGK